MSFSSAQAGADIISTPLPKANPSSFASKEASNIYQQWCSQAGWHWQQQSAVAGLHVADHAHQPPTGGNDGSNGDNSSGGDGGADGGDSTGSGQGGDADGGNDDGSDGGSGGGGSGGSGASIASSSSVSSLVLAVVAAVVLQRLL